jgi:hypothetical protein
MIPPGGSLTTSGKSWTVHGIRDGVPYRFDGPGSILLVANQPGLSWETLTVENSWYVGCWTHVPTDTPHCNAMLDRLSGNDLMGFTLIDADVCPSSGVDLNGFWPSELAVDGGRRYAVDPGRRSAVQCLSVQDSAAATQEMLSGHAVTVRGLHDRNAPTEIRLSLYGFPQALTMRHWLLGQMTMAKLPLVP